MVTSYRYLERVILESDENWTAVIQNIEKAQAVWMQMMMILSREGVRLWVSGFIFKYVINTVLLFGAETWVVTPPHGTIPRGVPVPGDTAAGTLAPAVVGRRKVGSHLGRGGKIR